MAGTRERQWQVIHGDCVDVMRAMEPNSIDAIVTDPPYGLSKEPDAAEVLRHWLAGDTYQHSSKGFMGRSWDSFVPGPEYWREVFRVLKPGGHLLCFAGTRTWDLMSMAIRLAGFENRDTISHFGPPALAWTFGSGFPKSASVSKHFDRMDAERHERALPVTRFITGAMRAKGLTRRDLNRAVIGADNDAGSAQSWTTVTADGAHKPRVPTWEQWQQLKALLGFGDEMDDEVWRLNGRKGQPGEAWYEREVLGAGADYGHQRSQTGYGFKDGFDITAPATDLARQWEGWGTALKPSWEVILCFRKPLAASTVAGNVAAWGVGALAIDACRVGYQGEQDAAFSARPGHEGRTSTANIFSQTPKMHAEQHPAGRWPPNLLLSHIGPDEHGNGGCQRVGTRRVKGDTGARPSPAARSDTEAWRFNHHERTGYADPDGTEEVAAWACVPGCPVAALDAQGGIRKSGGYPAAGGQRSHVATYGTPNERGEQRFGASEGHCSRFFPVFSGEAGAADFVPFLYCAKASRRERRLGMPEDMQASHPCVKPLSLCDWLVKLVTPPNGLVLDPFCGSGSVGCSAVRQGYCFIGIDQDATYCEQARARIGYWAAQGQAPPKAPARAGAPAADLGPLFQGVAD